MIKTSILNQTLSSLLDCVYRGPTAKPARSLAVTRVHRGKAASRNGKCPCGSGRKFKRCCLRDTATKGEDADAS